MSADPEHLRFDGVRYFVARCIDCSGISTPNRMDIPFDNAPDRDGWATAHRTQGHNVITGRGTYRDLNGGDFIADPDAVERTTSPDIDAFALSATAKVQAPAYATRTLRETAARFTRQNCPESGAMLALAADEFDRLRAAVPSDDLRVAIEALEAIDYGRAWWVRRREVIRLLAASTGDREASATDGRES